VDAGPPGRQFSKGDRDRLGLEGNQAVLDVIAALGVDLS